MTKTTDKRRLSTELCSGPYYMGKLYPIEAFDQAVFKPLKEQPYPVGYDALLTEAFMTKYDATA